MWDGIIFVLYASYFSLDYADVQDKNVNMQHNYADMLDNGNLENSQKSSRFSPTCDFQHSTCNLFTRISTCEIC
jgi:hypothetical protein